MLAPYIGITDFTDFNQVETMLWFLEFCRTEQAKRESARMLHVGVMMSYKTLNDIETKWSKAFPPKETIADIFRSNRPLNCLHYADYDHRRDFSDDVLRAVNFCGKYIHAVQLDMVWPNPVDIKRLTEVRDIEVILQIGKNAIEEANNNPTEVVSRLEDYNGLVDRVLLDKSMGRGLGMDAIGLLPFAHAIRNQFPQMGIGAAGGLGPDSMHLVEPLVKEFPDLSIDAQGKLRPSGNALDPIDWNMAAKYLEGALKLFGESRSSTL